MGTTCQHSGDLQISLEYNVTCLEYLDNSSTFR